MTTGGDQPVEPGSTAVLRLTGDVDFATEDDFRARAELLLAREDLQELVVDMAEVNFVDSSGLGLLVDLLRLCRETGIAMSLRAVPAATTTLLQTTGLSELFLTDRDAR